MNRWTGFAARLALAALTALGVGQGALATEKKALLAPNIDVTGGINPSGFNTPGLFTWHSNVPISGTGWASGESVNILLYGPINSLGVTPTLTSMASLVADGSGAINGSFQIPYDEGGAFTIPRPGYYEVRAGAPSGFDANPPHINICPSTYKADGIDWSYDRGGRDGGTGDIKRVFPHWMFVWDKKPAGVYGTVDYTDTDGNNMPSFMRHSEYPGDHYAHDFNIMLVPDEPYRWILGTVNYYKIEDKEPNREFGRIEVEHEMLNNGNPFSYGSGVIGMPLFVLPTPGDRCYIVGNWVLDAGHPDKGDRTEIHPPRLLATIRKRPTVVALDPNLPGCMTYASQVDVYLSGHGGGGGRLFYSLQDGLDAADGTSHGGGRIKDVISGSQLDDYYSGDITTSTGLDVAYFSGFGGYNRLPESQAINDMNYEFDVPLPAPPAGATTPRCEVTNKTNHGTSVVAQITYTNPVGGLPTVAHVLIPAQGGDNGIYSATYKFSWDKFKPPAKHFQIRLQNLLVKDDSDDFIGSTGEWYLWADVAGKWVNLTQLNTDAFLDADDDDEIGLTGSGAIDVYVNPGDPLYAAVFGYEQDCLDDLFGTGFGWDSLAGALNLAGCAFDLPEPLDNDDLAGAIFKFDNPTKTNAPGNYSVHSANAILDDGDSHYRVDLKVDYVPAPPRIELNGLPADFGKVCIGQSKDQVVTIFNIGEEDLEVNTITVAGVGYTLLGPNLPFVIQGGHHVDVTVRFSPTAPGQGDGTVEFESTDHCQPKIKFDLDAQTVYPVMTLAGSLHFGDVPIDDRTIGHKISKPFLINNTGECPLVVTSVTVTAGGPAFSVQAPPSFPQTIQPGGSLTVPVYFDPSVKGPASATVEVKAGNDPTHPDPLTIIADGTGIIPFATATPGATIFDPTVVNCSRVQNIRVFNNGKAELIIDNAQVFGTGYTLAPVSLPIRLAPNTDTFLKVTFTPPSIARKFQGSLQLDTNDPDHPMVVTTFCGEGTPIGYRVLVKQANGTPYAKVDQITLASYGVNPNTNVSLKNVLVKTDNTGCLPITYHHEMKLPATDVANKRGSQYNLKVKVGNKAQSVSFTLGPCEFKTIVITLQ